MKKLTNNTAFEELKQQRLNDERAKIDIYEGTFLFIVLIIEIYFIANSKLILALFTPSIAAIIGLFYHKCKK